MLGKYSITELQPLGFSKCTYSLLLKIQGILSWDPSQLWELYSLLLFCLNKLSCFTHDKKRKERKEGGKEGKKEREREREKRKKENTLTCSFFNNTHRTFDKEGKGTKG
jgi:hypothetical protein